MIPRKELSKMVGNRSPPLPPKRGVMNRKFTMLTAIEAA
jgi:hypothetical protein